MRESYLPNCLGKAAILVYKNERILIFIQQHEVAGESLYFSCGGGKKNNQRSEESVAQGGGGGTYDIEMLMLFH